MASFQDVVIIAEKAGNKDMFIAQYSILAMVSRSVPLSMEIDGAQVGLGLFIGIMTAKAILHMPLCGSFLDGSTA